MKNKSFTKVLVIICAIIFLIYSISVMLLVSEKNELFWVSYIFIFLALLISTLSVFISDLKTNLETLPIPVVIFGFGYFVFQLLISTILFNVSIPVKTSVVIHICLFSIYIIVIMLILFSNKKIELFEEEKNRNKGMLKKSVSTLEFLYHDEENEDKKKILKEVYEKFRYSDPISSAEEVMNMDKELNDMINELAGSIKDMPLEVLKNNQSKLISCLNKRNIACRNSK